jgi:hypothetical protein
MIASVRDPLEASQSRRSNRHPRQRLWPSPTRRSRERLHRRQDVITHLRAGWRLPARRPDRGEWMGRGRAMGGHDLRHSVTDPPPESPSSPSEPSTRRAEHHPRLTNKSSTSRRRLPGRDTRFQFDHFPLLGRIHQRVEIAFGPLRK